MEKISYQNGILTINGNEYLQIDNSSLISRTISADKNVYSVEYFKNLPSELKAALKNTCWIRISESTKTYERPTNNIPAVAGL